ncbi:MAG: HD domain-containing protein [Bryobacterales bacterium]|nr:HD domain-containing protein [Bryobacterales bacterium]
METQHSRQPEASVPETSPAMRSFLETGDSALALAGRTAHVDSVVRDAYEKALLPVYPRGVAVLAVGGYGRKELFPHSDIDVLLLEANPPGEGERAALSRFLQSIWDEGLRPSHSLRSLRDCLEVHESNLELNISLLDMRFLAGDEELFGQASARMPKFLAANRAGLVRRLCRMTRARHAKFQGTIYHLEPNIKESPGGLRDWNVLEWMGKLRPDGAGAPLTAGQLRESRKFLHTARCFLHYRSNRDNNLLGFDAQEELAAAAFSPASNASAWMREYFRNARAIWRETLRTLEASEGESSSLLAGFRDWRARLSNAEFTVSRDRVLLRYPHAIEKDPAMVMRLFLFVGRHGIALHRETENRLRQYEAVLREYFASPEGLWPLWHDLAGLPHAGFALRAMHETGVLGMLFPEWTSIECEVIRDFNHRYTVDEHTLIAIQNLEELRETEDPARKRFAVLLAELPDPALLNCALLFHDVAKAGENGGEGHAAASRRIAEVALRRLGAPEEALEMAGFLVEHHLDLSAAMTGRDLEDEATAVYLAHRMETIEKLKYLTLMTYADTGAVHPTALSPWRLEQLFRVYAVAYRQLTHELETERIESRPASPEQEAFLKGFPTRYLRTHTEAQIRIHAQLDELRKAAGVALEIRRAGGVYELSILTKDRHFLFASIAGALASFGLNILKAEAFANQQGTVLDTFVFADPARNLELNPPEMDRLKHTLERVIAGRVEVRGLLKNRPKPTPPSKGSRIQPRINFDNEASHSATLVEVVAEDRPGLLYDIASAFSEAGCSIEVVLIDTEAHKAIDVFYITSDGKKLEAGRLDSIRRMLLETAGG